MSACAEKHAQHESSVTQRLKWAAGANPSLSNTLRDFEDSCRKRDHLVRVRSAHDVCIFHLVSLVLNCLHSIQTEHDVITEIITICNSILHFEALRTRTTEAFAADDDFRTLLKKYTCTLLNWS